MNGDYCWWGNGSRLRNQRQPWCNFNSCSCQCPCNQIKNNNNCYHRPPIRPVEPSCNCKNVGIQAILQNTASLIIDENAPIIFDTVLTSVGRGIVYNQETGAFLIKQPGHYKVSWQIVVEGSNASRFINFGINVNDDLFSSLPMPVTAGTFGSDTLITTKTPNSTVTLVNNTGDTVRLSRHLPSANIVITSLSLEGVR